MDPLLRLRGVSLGYKGRPVLDGVSFVIERGEFAALLGPNGAGKTTLFRGILGLIPVLAGRIEYGFDRRATPPGYVPQKESLDPIFPLTAYEVVLMGAAARVLPLWPVGRRRRHLAAECLARVGLSDAAEEPFWALSGGQKQRVLIARALAVEPHGRRRSWRGSGHHRRHHAPQSGRGPDRRHRQSSPAPSPGGGSVRHLGGRGLGDQGDGSGDALHRTSG